MRVVRFWSGGRYVASWVEATLITETGTRFSEGEVPTVEALRQLAPALESSNPMILGRARLLVRRLTPFESLLVEVDVVVAPLLT